MSPRRDRNREVTKAVIVSYLKVTPNWLVIFVATIAAAILLVSYAEPRFPSAYKAAKAGSIRYAQGRHRPGRPYIVAELKDGTSITVTMLPMIKTEVGSKICLSEQRGALTGRRTYTLVPLERCVEVKS